MLAKITCFLKIWTVWKSGITCIPIWQRLSQTTFCPHWGQACYTYFLIKPMMNNENSQPLWSVTKSWYKAKHQIRSMENPLAVRKGDISLTMTILLSAPWQGSLGKAEPWQMLRPATAAWPSATTPGWEKHFRPRGMWNITMAHLQETQLKPDFAVVSGTVKSCSIPREKCQINFLISTFQAISCFRVGNAEISLKQTAQVPEQIAELWFHDHVNSLHETEDNPCGWANQSNSEKTNKTTPKTCCTMDSSTP